MKEDGNFLVDLQNYAPKSANLDVRHGGIPDKCFETLGKKRDSQSDYLEALKLI